MRPLKPGCCGRCGYVDLLGQLHPGVAIPLGSGFVDAVASEGGDFPAPNPKVHCDPTGEIAGFKVSINQEFLVRIDLAGIYIAIGVAVEARGARNVALIRNSVVVAVGARSTRNVDQVFNSVAVAVINYDGAGTGYIIGEQGVKCKR